MAAEREIESARGVGRGIRGRLREIDERGGGDDGCKWNGKHMVGEG